MSLEGLAFAAAVIAILGIGLWLSWRSTRRQHGRDLALLQDAKARGIDMPVSLHPVIDTTVCMGSAACVAACPEQDVLGLISGRGTLIAAANCVGHGACAASCPVDAITLVFGTEQRGVELPALSPQFETNQPGVYIAGELGGMGLIANAFEQAIQAVDAIAAELRDEQPQPELLDLVVVGAGPAGLGGALRAKELGLRYACVDQAAWGGAVRTYPRAKVVMTRPVRVPLYGPVKLRQPTKEALLQLWDEIVRDTEVEVRTETTVTGVARDGDGWRVDTSTGPLHCRRVLLAIGRRGSPRMLGVPGDSGANVTTHLIEPERWAHQRLVVVGGGDVAAEAALALIEQPGTTVTMIYRGKSLYRPKPALRERVMAAAERGALQLRLETEVVRVDPDALVVSRDGVEERLVVDQVFACLGGAPPTRLLDQIGISMVTKYGEA